MQRNFVTQFSYVLCLLFVFLLPWERLINFGSLGTVSRLVGMLTAATWLFGAVRNGVRRPEPIHGLVFAFFLLNLASFLWSVDGPETIKRSVSYFSITIMVLVFWDLFRDKYSLRSAFQALVLGGFVPAFTVVKNYLAAVQLEWGRYATGADNENTTAYTLAITLPFAVYLVATPSNPTSDRWAAKFADRLLRLINLVYLPICVYAVALTGTRFAMIMMFPLAAYLLLGQMRTRPFAAGVIAVVGVLSLIVMSQFLPVEIVERLASTGEEVTSGDLNGRIGMWKIAAQTFADHPIFGTGSATSNAASIPFIGYAFSTHNSFLALLVELGVVGLSLALAIMFCVFRYAWTMPRDEGSFWLMVLAVWFLGNLPLTNFHNKPTWLIFGLLTCAYFAVRRDKVDAAIPVLQP